MRLSRVWRCSLLAATLAARGTCAPAAVAATPRVALAKLSDNADPRPPQLGVDARGGAVVAWLAPTAGAGDGLASILASPRPPGRDFAAAQVVARAAIGVASYSLAVGSRGDAAIVWALDRSSAGPLLVSRRGRGRGHGGRFSRRVKLPGSIGGLQPAAAIDARGRLLVAWLREPGPDGCGLVVMASAASLDGRFGRPRRLSERCSHATLVRAALARAGDGAVAWRDAGARSPVSASSVKVSAYAGGRFHAAQTASDLARVGPTLALAAGGRRLLAAWRDEGDGAAIRGRVLTAAIDGARLYPPVAAVSLPGRVVDEVSAAMNAIDGAAVAWEPIPRNTSLSEIDPTPRAAISPSFGAPFVQVHAAFEGDDDAVRVALDRRGRGLMGYSGSLVRRFSATAPPGRAIQLFHRYDYGQDAEIYPSDMRVGLSDAGEGVAAWLIDGTQQSSFSRVRAAILRAPASR